MHSLPTLNWLGFDARGDLAPLRPLPEVASGIAASGCRGIGLDDVTVEAFLRHGGTVERLPPLLRGLDLHCTDIGILRIGAVGAVPLARSLALLAAAIDAPTCIAVLDAPVSPQIVEELGICADILSGAGARLALEFTPYGHLRTLADAVRVCEEVGWERCGVLVDTWHFFVGGSPWSQLRALGRGRIALVHVNDARLPADPDLVYESRFRRLPPGEGAFPIGQFAEVLASLGYRGVISAEVLSAELRDRSAADAASTIMRALREQWPLPEPARSGAAAAARDRTSQ
jgi:sugar phosphate isomerase/epimerase